MVQGFSGVVSRCVLGWSGNGLEVVEMCFKGGQRVIRGLSGGSPGMV